MVNANGTVTALLCHLHAYSNSFSQPPYLCFVFVTTSTRGTPSAMSKNIGAAAASRRRGGDLKGSSPRPSMRGGGTEHTSVTLDDVKSVALDSMPDVDLLPAAFQGCYRLDIQVQFLKAQL